MDNYSPIITNLLNTSPYLNIYDNTQTISVEEISNAVYSNIDSIVGIKNGYIDVLDNSSDCNVGDKSLKNSIDVLLHPYIKLFRDKGCETTSSCSGRIVILSKNLNSSSKKFETLLLKVSHSHFNIYNTSWKESVISGTPFYTKQTTKLSPEVEIFLKYEPFVIHVEFPSLDHAIATLEHVKECGLKQSGLISARKRYILAIRGSKHFEAPIAVYNSNGIEWLVTEYTLNYYLRECNKKHSDNLGALVKSYWNLYYNFHNVYTYSNILKPSSDEGNLNEYKYLKRWGSSSCIIRDDIYVFGGFSATANPPILSIYSIEKDLWIDVHQSNIIKRVFSCILPIFNDKILIIMGRSSPTCPSDEVHMLSLLENYELMTVKPIDVVPPPRFRHSVAPAENNSFYMYGGITHEYKFIGDLWKGTICKEDNQYTISWDQLVECPLSFASSTISFYSDSVYLIGGMNTTSWSSYMDKIWTFDTNECIWRLKVVGGEKYPVNRASHCSVQIKNSIIIVGGISTDENTYGSMLFDIWRLDLDIFKWYYLGDVPHDNTIIKSSMVYDSNREKLYIIGGGVVCFTFGSVFQRPLAIPVCFSNSLSGNYLEISESRVVKQCKNFCQTMGWYDHKRKIICRNNKFLIPVNLHGQNTSDKHNSGSKIHHIAIQFIANYFSKYDINVQNIIGNLNLRKYERLGHVLLFNEDLTVLNKLIIHNGFDQSLLDTFYEQLTCVIEKRIKGIKAIGVKGIVEGDIRNPNVKILFGNPTTQVIENGIKYILDVTKCMFSSGNVTERIRIPVNYMYNDKFELVIDMFCGIGYFSLPILTLNSSCKLVVTDINDEALNFFRKGLKANSINPSRVDILPGDCRNLSNSKYIGSADRILLGLLPDSSIGWETAVILSHRNKPCMLHVHVLSDVLKPLDKLELTKVSSDVDYSTNHDYFKKDCIDELLYAMYKIVREYVSKGIVTHKHIEIVNIVKVKRYSPFQFHYVIDLILTPNLSINDL